MEEEINLWEELINETYLLISENIDLTNIYEYNSKGRNWWEFIDKRSITHQIKLNYSPGVDQKELSVKFYWLKDKKPSYDKPPYTDEKVFNTYLKILLDVNKI